MPAVNGIIRHVHGELSVLGEKPGAGHRTIIQALKHVIRLRIARAPIGVIGQNERRRSKARLRHPRIPVVWHHCIQQRGCAKRCRSHLVVSRNAEIDRVRYAASHIHRLQSIRERNRQAGDCHCPRCNEKVAPAIRMPYVQAPVDHQWQEHGRDVIVERRVQLDVGEQERRRGRQGERSCQRILATPGKQRNHGKNSARHGQEQESPDISQLKVREASDQPRKTVLAPWLGQSERSEEARHNSPEHNASTQCSHGNRQLAKWQRPPGHHHRDDPEAYQQKPVR